MEVIILIALAICMDGAVFYIEDGASAIKELLERHGWL